MGKSIVRRKDTYENFKKSDTEMLNITLLADPGNWKKTIFRENHFGAVLLNKWQMHHVYRIATLKKAY
jgi:hypothetical protein